MTTKNRESLDLAELETARRGECPDCGHKGFLAGPRGGLSQNFKCANEACGSQFNDMGPFGIDRISDASPDRKEPMKHFQVRESALCGSEGELTGDRKRVDCPKCLGMMEPERTDDDLIDEGLNFLSERDYVEAAALLQQQVEANTRRGALLSRILTHSHGVPGGGPLWDNLWDQTRKELNGE